VTAAALLLDWRAGNGAIRAEYAAIAGFGSQQCLAAGTLVKILAGVGGHGLLALIAARGAGDDRLQYGCAQSLSLWFDWLLDYLGSLAKACQL
jgi:hypothetical protein